VIARDRRILSRRFGRLSALRQGFEACGRVGRRRERLEGRGRIELCGLGASRCGGARWALVLPLAAAAVA
jgi:hypothetical protein